MVGDTTLREIVSPYAFRAIAAPYQRFALGGLLGVSGTLLFVLDARGQNR
jgi:hypothetical protein